MIDYARRAGFRELYLYSACRDFYERFGWRYIGEGLDYPATAVHLYRYDLSLLRGDHRVTTDQRRAEQMGDLRRRPLLRQG